MRLVRVVENFYAVFFEAARGLFVLDECYWRVGGGKDVSLAERFVSRCSSPVCAVITVSGFTEIGGLGIDEPPEKYGGRLNAHSPAQVTRLIWNRRSWVIRIGSID